MVSIYSVLIDCLKQTQLQVSRIVGMGFAGVSTISGSKAGVQMQMKNATPHDLLCTVTATCLSWHVFKLPIQFQELNMYMWPWHYCGSFFSICQRESNIWRRFRISLICLHLRWSSHLIPAGWHMEGVPNEWKQAMLQLQLLLRIHTNSCMILKHWG